MRHGSVFCIPHVFPVHHLLTCMRLYRRQMRHQKPVTNSLFINSLPAGTIYNTALGGVQRDDLCLLTHPENDLLTAKH
jgi:hypothetical protein